MTAPDPHTPASEAEMREAFEAFDQCVGCARFNTGEYADCYRQERWRVWQAAHSHARAEMEAREAASPELKEYVEGVIKEYRSYVSATPDLLSLLYDIDLLPEQLLHVLRVNPSAAGPNATRMSAVCELWKRQAPCATLAEPQPTGAGEG